jgi:hypothetical protein
MFAGGWQAAAGSLLLASLILTAAGFFNGAPLLYPDSIDYLLHGSEAAGVLFFGDTVNWWSTRSFLYALVILPLHGHTTVWPVAAFHALLTAWLVWLTLRTVLSRTSPARFLIAISLITLLTSVSWFVSYVMPDIFAALLILGTNLLCFQWGRLSRRERLGVIGLVWFSIVSHTSHMLIAGGLIPVVVVVGASVVRSAENRLLPAARLAAVTLVAICATLAVNAALLGEPSLSGRRPPFLLARVVADGTAQPYLQEHCDDLELALCERAQSLPDNIRDVLWSEGSLWGSASRELRQRMSEEEMQVVIGSIRNDPIAQTSASVANFWNQLNTFGLWGSYYPDPYIEARIHEALPRFAESFQQTRQGREALHEGFFGCLHRVSLIVSLGAILLFGLLLGRRIPAQLAAFATVVGLGVIGNAAITGVLSNVEERYQSRVVWLIPLLAFVAGACWGDRRARRTEMRTRDPVNSEEINTHLYP